MTKVADQLTADLFLTIGTQEPFDRLTRAMDDWAAAHPEVSIFGQLGRLAPDSYRPSRFTWAEFIDADRYQQLVGNCVAIVAHAGMGSIISALTYGKPLLIMPRRASLGEHRNEHQWATAEKFAGRPGVAIAWEESEVAPLLDRIIAGGSTGGTVSPHADPGLLAALRAFIHGEAV